MQIFVMIQLSVLSFFIEELRLSIEQETTKWKTTIHEIVIIRSKLMIEFVLVIKITAIVNISLGSIRDRAISH
ncbi:hypothetical protein D3C80_2019200 [compost metagenome]